MGSERMIEILTEKNLDLEEKLRYPATFGKRSHRIWP